MLHVLNLLFPTVRHECCVNVVIEILLLDVSFEAPPFLVSLPTLTTPPVSFSFPLPPCLSPSLFPKHLLHLSMSSESSATSQYPFLYNRCFSMAKPTTPKASKAKSKSPATLFADGTITEHHPGTDFTALNAETPTDGAVTDGDLTNGSEAEQDTSEVCLYRFDRTVPNPSWQLSL